MKQLLHLLVISMLGMCVLSSKTVANEKIHSLVTQKAIEHNVPPSFAHGIIMTESRYNPNAKNGSSIGLGQIQCRTAKGIGLQGECKGLYDPETNLMYSMKYLRMALDRAKGNQCYAATLYNRGLGANPSDSGYCRKVFSKMKTDLPAKQVAVKSKSSKKKIKVETKVEEPKSGLAKFVSGNFTN